MNKAAIQQLIKFVDDLNKLGLISEAAEADKILHDHVKTIEEKIEEAAGSYGYQPKETNKPNLFSEALGNIKADIISASKQPGSQISPQALIEIVRIIDGNIPKKAIEPEKNEIFAKQTGVVIGQTIAEFMRDIGNLQKEYGKAQESEQPKIEKELKHIKEQLSKWEKELDKLKASDPKSYDAVIKYIEQKKQNPMANVSLLPEKRKE